MMSSGISNQGLHFKVSGVEDKHPHTCTLELNKSFVCFFALFLVDVYGRPWVKIVHRRLGTLRLATVIARYRDLLVSRSHQLFASEFDFAKELIRPSPKIHDLLLSFAQ